MNNSLLANGYKKPKKPDFKQLDVEALDSEIPGLVDGMTGDPGDVKICEFCGAEIRRLELPDPFGRHNKVFRPMPACQCVIDANEKKRQWEERMERKRRLQKTYAKNIMAASLNNARLDNFEMREGTTRAYEKAQEFYATFETRNTGLLLFGPVGNGKSHLARAIEYQLDRDGWVTLFLDWPQLSEMAKATFSGGNVTVADYVRAAIDADLLVLDEIGAGHLTVWEFQTLLFPILNGRSGRKTIFTTNLDLGRLEKWFLYDKDGRTLDEDGRLIDRIIGGCEIVKNSGSSKRREDAKRRMVQ